MTQFCFSKFIKMKLGLEIFKIIFHFLQCIRYILIYFLFHRNLTLNPLQNCPEDQPKHHTQWPFYFLFSTFASYPLALALVQFMFLLKGAQIKNEAAWNFEMLQIQTWRPRKLKLHQPVYLIRYTGWWSFSFLRLHNLDLEHSKVSAGLVSFLHPLLHSMATK